MEAFLSYAHEDEQAKDALREHAAILLREEFISIWQDREILPGDHIDELIDNRIEGAALILPLISPSFIASEYCMGREMKRALERSQEGTARVVPIIVRPCEWMEIGELSKLNALPKDARPISTWSNADEAWTDVVSGLRRLIQAFNSGTSNLTQTEPVPGTKPSGRTSSQRTRVQRDFSEIDHDDFRERAFDTIKEHFRRSIDEIKRQDGVQGKFTEVDAKAFGCTIVNQYKGGATAHITVRTGCLHLPSFAVYWLFEKNAQEGAMEGAYTIESDGYSLHLEPSFMNHSESPGPLNPEQAAERLWREFSGRGYISYD